MATAPNPIVVESQAIFQFTVPANSTVSVTVSYMASGYLYVVPVASGYGSDNPVLNYGGQFELTANIMPANSSAPDYPASTYFFTAAYFAAAADGVFTFQSGGATNIAIVLQRIGGYPATAQVSIANVPQSPVLNVPPPVAGTLPLSTNPVVAATGVVYGDDEPLALLSDGTVVLGGGNQWYTSPWPDPASNSWSQNNLSTVGTTDVQGVAQLANGQWLVTTSNTTTNPEPPYTGQLWICEADGSNPQQLIPQAGAPANTQGMGFSNSFPILVQDNLAVVSEYFPINYGVPSMPDGAVNVWLVDASSSPAVVTSITPPASMQLNTEFHHHGMAYDPWETPGTNEQLYWLVTGDGTTSASILLMVLNTATSTATWYQAVNWGELPFQCTNIVPMQDFVLFISDDAQVGVLRYDRVSGGTVSLLQSGQYIQPVVAWVFQDPWPTGGEETEIPLATIPALASGPQAAYWGWQVQSLALPVVDPTAPAANVPVTWPNPLSNIYTTADGVNFYQVQIGPPCSGAGVQGVFGPDQAGNLLVASNTQNNSETWNAVQFAHNDVWGPGTS